jgi:hypothetical protein
MNNFDISNSGSENLDPIPFEDDDTGSTNISHSPLNLGGGSSREAPQAEAPAQLPRPIGKKPAEKTTSSERISGVKTFFTKLHPGALDFLDEQITHWLKENPGITIKRTNTVTGEIAGKKTEPNIIITVWY